MGNKPEQKPEGKPEIVVFGKNGQVGHELLNALSNIAIVHSFDMDVVDFTKEKTITATLKQIKPDIIINAVAYTAVDKAEQEQDLAHQVNARGPQVIAEFAEKYNTLFIHYSTDFVFDGQSDKPYLESDIPNPLSVYGSTKLAGEELVLNSGCKSIVLRTSWVYGLRGANFVLTMLRLAHKLEQMKVVDDQLGSPVWCGYIAQTTAKIIENLLHDSPDLSHIDENKLGLFHITASTYTSWYGFAQAILEKDPNKKQQICHELSPIPSSEYPTPAERPKWSVLDNSKLQSTFNLDIPSWEEQFEQMWKKG